MMHMPISCWCEDEEGVLQTQLQSEHQEKNLNGMLSEACLKVYSFCSLTYASLHLRT